MSTFDLTESFISLVSLQDERHPALGLSKDLGKVNVALSSFAESQGLKRDGLSVMDVCVDNQHLHPALLKRISSLERTEAYKGQTVSRLKKLVRHLPWPQQRGDDCADQPAVIEEQSPPHLRHVWFLLPRVNSGRFRNVWRNSLGHASNGKRHFAPPLSLVGISLARTLLRVSKAQGVSDMRTLVEDCSGHVYKDIRLNHPPHRRWPLVTAFCHFRLDVRAFLKYRVGKRQPVAFALDELPEPLRAQVITFKDRAKNGFKTDREIQRVARSRYGLELGLQSEAYIRNCVNIICLALGYVPRDLYGVSLDLRDLMRLRTRDLEIDGTAVTELYNPIVDYYREHEMSRASKYKEMDYDSRAFGMFLEALCAVAAYNGFLRLREIFSQTYKARPDRMTLKRRKRHKKEVFDRVWLDSQIRNLKSQFHRIVDEGSFKSRPDGGLSREAHDNLNLCLFYVALLILRFLGVRQQCVRDCVVGENVVFGTRQRVTFKWVEEETKNGKGLIHRLSMQLHSGVLGELIDAVWTYHKKIYPYISGDAQSDEPPELKERRRNIIARQFLVKIRTDGLCAPFISAEDFTSWFSRVSLKYLDFEGRLDEIDVPPSPHFYRAMFGDWLRYDKKCSAEETADMAGDSERTFEAEYIDHPTTFDATDIWTRLSQEAKRERESGSAVEQSETASLRALVKSQAKFIEQLQEQIDDMKSQTVADPGQLTSAR